MAARTERIVETAVALVLLVAGLVLAIGFADAELWWFRGRPLGVVLAVIGALDLLAAVVRREPR